MELNNIIEKFNKALRKSAKDKFYELKETEGASDAVLYRFDFNRSDKERIEVNNLDKVPIPQDNIEYFWIEYIIKNQQKDQRMKLALFFRDIDTTSHNVHVIPGLFEKYELKEDMDPNKPYVVVENGKAVIKNVGGIIEINGKMKENKYPSFAEPCDNGGWWVPKKECIPLRDDNKTVNEKANDFGAIDNFRKIFTEFSEFEDKASISLYNHLKGMASVKSINQHHDNVTERYFPVFWYNINDKSYSMDLFKIFYFPNYGFFTQYNCINLTSLRKDIVTNYPIVEKNTESDYNALKSPLSLSGDWSQIIEILSKIGGTP